MKYLLLILITIFVYSCNNLRLREPQASEGYAKHNHSNHKGDKDEEKEEYTCAMHPSVKTKSPDDKCPICNMDLVLVERHGHASLQKSKNKYQCKEYPDIKSEVAGECPADGSPMILIPKAIYTQFMDKKKVLASGIKLYTIKYDKEFKSVIRTTGKISYDERKMKHLSAQFPGRIEKLWINYEGQYVKKGEKVLSIYSPQLIEAQNELISILKSKSFSTKANIDSAKKKLQFLGVSAWQIKQITKNLKPIKNIVIYAAFTGIVTKKFAHEKMYFKEGQNFFDIVDLSIVWALIDIYEYNISKIKLKSKAELSFVSGIENYKGEIEYISPYLNLKNRTVKARLSLDNTSGKYLPNMFLNASIDIDYEDVTKYIVLPRSAVLSLGKNKVVFKDIGNNHFEAWKVKVVDYNQNNAIIKKESFLANGDNIVQKGGFIIDSQSQISGNASSLYGNSIDIP